MSHLDAALKERIEEARRAWPGIDLPTKSFIAHLERLSTEADASAKLHISDLYLACACTLGDPHALLAFEERLMAQVPRHVARIDSSPAFADEVKQHLREKLFVGHAGSPAKIAAYSGRGPLGGWLRVTAIRVAQNLRRGRSAASVSERALDGAAAATADPEMEYFKRKYGSIFRSVLEAVLQRLPEEQRAVLRLHFVDGLTVRAIGKLYRVNASTITRWIAQARECVMDETRTRLRDQLVVDDRSLDSILALIESRFDLTLSRVLSR